MPSLIGRANINASTKRKSARHEESMMGQESLVRLSLIANRHAFAYIPRRSVSARRDTTVTQAQRLKAARLRYLSRTTAKQDF